MIVLFTLLLMSISSAVCLDLDYQRPPTSKDLALHHSRLQLSSRDPHYPDQVHLALAGPGRLAVSWVTWPSGDSDLQEEVESVRLNKTLDKESATYPTSSGFYDSKFIDEHSSVKKKQKKHRCKHLEDYPLEPTVRFWLDGQDQQNSATGRFSCYSSSSYWSGALHEVIIGQDQPLNASNLYYYQVGDPDFGFSSVYNFTMAPELGPASIPYREQCRLGLIGDLGQTEDSAKTLQHLDNLNVRSVLNVGDLSYADSFQPRWDSWGRLLQFHASRIPWMHIEGNHEEEDIDGEEGFVAYEERFYFPAAESHSHSPFYYSYETGPIHVTMLGCYVDYSPNSDQAEWLKRDLASVDRLRTPWLIVGMHAPWYNSNSAHQGEMDTMRDNFEPILNQFGVDVVFAGHIHAYEMSGGGVLKGERVPCAPVYINIGDGGNREGLATSYLKKPTWSGFREASFGMGILDIQNSTHALWQWHRNQDTVTQVANEYWFVKRSECSGIRVGG